ncbi:zf-HC2 domain-containing protein [Methylovulum psychrotolerans]|uniref:zf-HC2 domain-containing protein n=1 Tax=Methylovulum psychrotolerans TaxID=1704499 RepID=UPI001BFFC708|nr:zf-HC2 domain-containing protein [Methylovulum psychrotolerans]MBT9097316.1 zf-HC2 domain-containing protein [Methylovulum psychrotolerans]
MPSCKQMTQLLSDSLETPLPWPKRSAMRLHLLICATCRRYRRHLLFMQKIITDHNPRLTALSDTAKQRIKDNLAQLKDKP